MKGKQGDLQRLYHILDAITDIQGFIGDITYDEYQKDYKLRLATVKLLEIIGEAVNHISPEITSKYNNEDWAAIKGMRNNQVLNLASPLKFGTAFHPWYNISW